MATAQTVTPLFHRVTDAMGSEYVSVLLADGTYSTPINPASSDFDFPVEARGQRMDTEQAVPFHPAVLLALGVYEDQSTFGDNSA